MRGCRSILTLASLAIGCAESKEILCEDGRVCAAGRVCDLTHGLCVLPEQVAACEGALPLAACDAPPGGNCQDSVCLPIACGNQRIDRGEVCDGAAGSPSLRCAADCRSDETCGNGVVDVATGERCDDENLLGNDGCSSQCTLETARWVRHTPDLSGRRDAAAAYDIARDVVVVFGGTSGFRKLSETFEWSGGSWRQLTVEGVAPTERSGHAMAYDARRRATVLFGGEIASGALGDTWEWTGEVWRPRLVAGPPRRAGHALVHDPRRGVTVLVGGRATAAGPELADTWEWDGNAWTEITSAGPLPASTGWSGAYDPRAGRVVISDGAQTLAYDGAGWASLPTPAPARTGPRLTFDHASARVVMAGGRIGGASSQELWALEGDAWVRLPGFTTATPGQLWISDGHVLITAGSTPTELIGGPEPRYPSGPPPRIGPAVARDPFRQQLVLVGGSDDVGVQGDTWILDRNGWRSLPGPIPARANPAMAYDARRQRVVLFGGTDADGTALADTWIFDGATWTRPTVTGPSGRSNATMAEDARGQLVLHGGQTDLQTYASDTWSWDGATWTPQGAGPQPPERTRATAAYDPGRAQLLLLGGEVRDGLDLRPLTDAWTWDGATWQALPDQVRTEAGAQLAWSPPRKAMLLGADPLSLTRERGPDGFVPVGASPQRPGVEGSALVTSLDGAAVETVCGGPQAASAARWELRWGSSVGRDACTTGLDSDGDGLRGCADPDCWPWCSPGCPPEAASGSCDPAAPRCGDGTCSAIESCRVCPEDCAFVTTCGDLHCDPGESMCPGDCP